MTGTIGQQVGGNNVNLVGSHCVLDVSDSSASPAGTTLSVFLSVSFFSAGSYGAYGQGKSLSTVDGPYSGSLGSLSVMGSISANTGIIVEVPASPSYYVLNDGVPSIYWQYCLADSVTHVCFQDAAHNRKYVSNCVADAGGHAGGLSIDLDTNPRLASDPQSVFGLRFTANSLTATGSRGVTCSYAPYYSTPVNYLYSANVFTVYDATPKLADPPLPPYDPDETGSFYITLYGTNLGRFQGSLYVCSDSSGSCNDFAVSLSGPSYTGWYDTQINAFLTPLTPAASEGGKYNIQVTSVGESGAGFLALQGLSQSRSKPVQMTFPILRMTPDVVVLAWLDPSAIALPGGGNSSLRFSLNTPGLCTLLLIDWRTNIRTFLSDSGDVDYANAWLLSHSGNSIPPGTINPTAALAAGDFRLFNSPCLKSQNM